MVESLKQLLAPSILTDVSIELIIALGLSGRGGWRQIGNIAVQIQTRLVFLATLWSGADGGHIHFELVYLRKMVSFRF